MQEEAAAEMNVARTTVTAMYESARHKIADCLLNGKRLVISGGSWQLKNQNIPGALAPKGANMKRIAVTHENGAVFQHFGHTAEFKLYDVESGSVTGSCDEAVQALLSGTLQYNPNVQCSHHHGDAHGEHGAGGEHGHADGHRCGNCGK